MSDSTLPPEQWRPLFDKIGVEFGYRPFAAHIGMDHTRLRRLLRGGGTSTDAIRQVADGFRVDPSVVRELRGERGQHVEPFTLPDDAGRLNETERTVVRAMVRALLDARDNAHAADQPAADPPAPPEGTQDQASAREKTAAQLQAHLDALTNGDIPVANEDRTALMAKLRAGIDVLQEQAHSYPDNPDLWPNGEPVYDGEDRESWEAWRTAGAPADWAEYRQGDYALAARDLGDEPVGRKIRRRQDEAGELPDPGGPEGGA